jgi:hypothetical protein
MRDGIRNPNYPADPGGNQRRHDGSALRRRSDTGSERAWRGRCLRHAGSRGQRGRPPRFSDRRVDGTIPPGGLAVLALTTSLGLEVAAFCLITNLTVAIILALAIGETASFLAVINISWLQEQTEPGLTGRVMSLAVCSPPRRSTPSRSHSPASSSKSTSRRRSSAQAPCSY